MMLFDGGMKTPPSVFATLCLSVLLTAPLASSLKADEPQPAGAKPKRAIIKVRVADDGSFAGDDFKPLADTKAVKAYIKAQRLAFEAEGKEPHLVVRGEEKALKEHGVAVMRMGFSSGVKASYWSKITRPRLIPAGEDLPKADKFTFVIAISEDGRVTMNGEAMDSGPDDRNITRLVDKLKLTATQHEDGAMGLLIGMMHPAAKSGVLYGPKNSGTSGKAVPNPPKKYETDPEAIKMLWETSEATTGIKFDV